jgi:signal transduction histidine kinase
VTLGVDISVGVVWCTLGMLLVPRRSRRGSGLLMLATGAAWLLGSAFPALTLLHRGPLVHLLVAYPRARPGDRGEQIVVGLGYLDSLQPIGRSHWVTAVLAPIVVGVTVTGFRRASGAERRARLTSSVCCAALLGLLGLGAVAAILGTVLDLVVIYQAAMLLTALALFADLRWGRWNRAAITSLVIDLGRSDGFGSVRDKLARALNDPALEIGFLDPATGSMIDETGRGVQLPPTGAGRQRTALAQNGQAIAVVAHAVGALDDPALLESMTAVSRLAFTNARLQAAVLARMAEVESSRSRILHVADGEREVLEAQLRSGAERRLAEVESLLDPTHEQLTALLSDSRSALRDFARGVHPRALAQGGLAAACAELTRTAPVSVTVDIPQIRLAAEIELSLYFVCAEALTNVVKYAHATLVRIGLVEQDDVVRLMISDNGCGGAVLGRSTSVGGTGLRGLADRLAVIGGTVTVDSPTGRGTVVTAEVRLRPAP